MIRTRVRFMVVQEFGEVHPQDDGDTTFGCGRRSHAMQGDDIAGDG